MPDSLITQLNMEMSAEDRQTMAALKEQLERQNAEKLAEMERRQAELEANLAR